MPYGAGYGMDVAATDPRVRARPTKADVSFGALGAALLMLACAFAVWGIPPMPPAPLVLAGIPSPLTGMTRSFVAIGSGDLVAALTFHPLGPLCFVACIVALANLVAFAVRGRRLRLVGSLLHPPLAIVVAVAFAVAWVRQIVVFG